MKIVANWRQAWRWWSIRLAFVAGIVGGYFATPQGKASLEALLAWVPEAWRPFLVFAIVTLTPSVVRLIQQEARDDG